MAFQLVCDGCRTPLYTIDDPKPSEATPMMIEGKRANGLSGGGLPNGIFHWCRFCSEIAFRAVNSSRRAE